MTRRDRFRVVERLPGHLGTIGSSPWPTTEVRPLHTPPPLSKEALDEARYTRADFEYFRTKPGKNWRIRPPQAGEKPMINARISPDHSQVLVMRPRIVSADDSSFVFFKADITTGPHNDIADPWVYVYRAALRTSTLWKHFQVANVENGYGALIETIEEEAFERADEFEDWCIQDIERTARLGWSLYAEAPLLKKFSSEIDATFGESSVDEIKQRMIEANVGAADPSLLEKSFPLLSGWKILSYWQTHESITLEPDDALLQLEDFADTPVTLPRPVVLIESNTGPDDDIHGFLFTKFRDPHGHMIFQIGELAIDGRIGFVEFRIAESMTWNEVAGLAQTGELQCAHLLRVLSYYALHRPTNTNRRIGVEILPKDHPLAPKPKEITMTAPVAVQKPPTTTPARTPISDILARIEAAYEERRRAGLERITVLRQALETYADAAKNDLTVDFARRNGVEDAGELQAPDAALHLAELVDRLPEMGGKENTGPRLIPAARWTGERNLAVAADEEIDAQGVGLVANESLPRIRQEFSENKREIVLIGGNSIPAKMPWLKSVLGYEPEWISTEDEAGSKKSQSLADRMARHSVAGVVFFHAFMSHKQTEPLVEAGRDHATPVVSGGRAGTGEVTRALLAIEKELA